MIKVDNRICCVIVSYKDIKSLKNTINHIYDQVAKVYVIDNNSNYNPQEINELKSNKNLTFYELEDNLGIARALNTGVKLALKEEFKFILTLDQDSEASKNMIVNMMEIYNKDINEEVGIVCPKIILSKKDLIEKLVTPVKTTITSGNLVRATVFNEIGMYEEKLFIDSVDFDFSLRVSNAGLKIYQVNSSCLFHSLGYKYSLTIFGKNLMDLSLHPPLRNYYIYRNHIFICQHYLASNFIFCFKKTISLIIHSFKNIIFHDKKLNVIKFSIKGIKDGLLGKYGQFKG